MLLKNADTSRVCSGGITSHIAAIACLLFATACSNFPSLDPGFLPSHVHSSASEKIAADLQTKVAAYRKSQSDLYDEMAANLDRIAVEEEELINKVAANYSSALITKAPTFTYNNLWQAVRRDVATDCKTNAAFLVCQADNLRSDIAANLKKDLTAQKIATSAAEDAKKAVKKFETEIAKAEANAKKWEQDAVRYREALSKLPDTVKGLSEKAKDLSKLFTSDGVLDEKAEATLKKLGIDPKDLLETFKNAKKTLKDKLSKELADAPGITVVILELGLELAELKKREVEAVLSSLKTRKKIYEEALAHLDLADGLTGILRGVFENNAGLKAENRELIEIVHVDIGKYLDGSAKANQITNAVFAKLMMVRLYVSAAWLVQYQEQVLPVKLARLDHAQSVVTSQLNDEAWQAMIESGVDALAAYHKGGLKEEDLANFFRLAQGIALFIIAA